MALLIQQILGRPDGIDLLAGLLPTISTEERAELTDLLAGVEPSPAPLSFKAWIQRVNPAYVFYHYCEVMIFRLQQVADGDLQNLFISMPPRHGKSLTLQLFVSYYNYRYPERWVGLSSYSGELAYFLARQAREYFLKGGGALHSKRDAEASKVRENAQRGGLWVAGAGGSITGRGGNLLVLDDPLKNDEEAESETIREHRNRWLQATWFTRGEPPGQKITVQTRWHTRDPIGFTLKLLEAAEYIEPWHYINFEAIKTDEPYELPRGVTLEPDWRQVGEALCPERFPVQKLQSLKGIVSSYYWNALYQGRPKPREGNRFKAEWFKVVDTPPASVMLRVRAYDIAGTDASQKTETKQPDFTAGVRASKGYDGIIYIEHMAYGQWSPARRNANILATAQRDAAMFGGMEAVKIGVERESGIDAGGRMQALIAALTGYPVVVLPAIANKEIRADPFLAQAEVGNVRLVKGDWNAVWLEQITAWMPTSTEDDFLDATAHAVTMLANLGGAVDAVPDTVPVATPAAYNY